MQIEFTLNMNKINVNRVISTELITLSASDQLYRIGLLYTRSQYEQGAKVNFTKGSVNIIVPKRVKILNCQILQLSNAVVQRLNLD